MTSEEAKVEALGIMQQVYDHELTPEAAIVLFEQLAEEIPDEVEK